MNYYNDHDDHSGCSSIAGLIVLIILVFMLDSFLDSLHVSNERRDAGMIYFADGYCYDDDTKIIYREMIVQSRLGDSPMYTPYITQDGNYCRYENGAWIAVDPADAY